MRRRCPSRPSLRPNILPIGGTCRTSGVCEPPARQPNPPPSVTPPPRPIRLPPLDEARIVAISRFGVGGFGRKGRSCGHEVSPSLGCGCHGRGVEQRAGARRRSVDRVGRYRQRPADPSRHARPVREEHRQQGHHRADAVLDDRPVRPVQAVAGGRQQRHRRLPDRRHLGAAARQPAGRSDRRRPRTSSAQHFPSIVESQTVNGKLVALPIFTDAPALYYRKDLLDKYGAKVPTTWAELADTAKMVQDKEREAGNKDMWGFVFQGNAYEGLTCDALEWVKSYRRRPDHRGRRHRSPSTTRKPPPRSTWPRAGSARSAPPGVLAYQEEESRGVWQTGNAVFMRNWPYAYSLGNGADFADQGQVRRDHAARRDRRQRPLGRDARRLEPRRVQILEEPGRGDRAGEVDRLARDAEIPRAEGLEPADHQGALRGSPTSPGSSRSFRAGRRCSSTPCRVPRPRPRCSTTRCRASSGRPCTRRCPARARPPTISPSSKCR